MAGWDAADASFDASGWAAAMALDASGADGGQSGPTGPMVSSSDAGLPPMRVSRAVSVCG